MSPSFLLLSGETNLNEVLSGKNTAIVTTKICEKLKSTLVNN